MKRLPLTAPVLALLLCLAPTAVAEPFDTHHTIAVRVGIHNYFPDFEGHEGTRPNDDPVVTDDEWLYVWEDAYRIQDFDSVTFEVGYEYKFLRWFGLALDFGFYGRSREFAFTVSGFSGETDATINVFHVDMAPRFHWLTRWTDFYGGPTIGYYNATAEFDIDLRYGPHRFSYDEKDEGDAIGWGAVIGFEVRIIRWFGIALEDRIVIALVDEFDSEDEEPLNVGGNILTLSAVSHF